MIMKCFKMLLVFVVAFSASGCALLGAAISAGAAYGISQAFK